MNETEEVFKQVDDMLALIDKIHSGMEFWHCGLPVVLAAYARRLPVADGSNALGSCGTKLFRKLRQEIYPLLMQRLGAEKDLYALLDECMCDLRILAFCLENEQAEAVLRSDESCRGFVERVLNWTKDLLGFLEEEDQGPRLNVEVHLLKVRYQDVLQMAVKRRWMVDEETKQRNQSTAKTL